MCDYCDASLYFSGEKELHAIYNVMNRYAYVVHSGRGKWMIRMCSHEGNDIFDVAILYCPMCGRELTKGGY